MESTFENVTIILVEPVYKGNVGAVCRTMNNFGFPNLRIVGKVPEKEDHYLAVHSEEILEQARLYDDLPSATEDMDLLIAFSRRRGSKKRVDLTADRVAAYVFERLNLRTGLVFGRETFGLTDEEADLCHLRCFIPTAPHFPSLNLSQAVGIVMYELFKHTFSHQENRSGTIDQPAPVNTMDEMIERGRNILVSMGYEQVGDPGKITGILYRALLRSNPNAYELREFNHFFQRIHLLARGQGYKET